MAYLDLVKLGKNHWWRYVLGVLLIVLMWQGLGLLPTVALAIWVELDQNDTTLFNTETLLFEGLPMEVIFADFMGMFLFLWLGVFLVVCFLHNRPFWSLFTPLQRLSWRRVLHGAVVFAAIYLAVGVIMEWLFPTPAKDIEYVLQPGKFLAFLPLALLLIPIQTSAEELLFRGYFMQGLGLIMNRWGVALVSSVLFALPHLLNPEVSDANLWIAFLPYWIIGLLLALITLRDGTLELALGVHASNNLTGQPHINSQSNKTLAR
ncbi:MAG: type II CAAX endopeptidase family protein [Candidatus Thiothrix putei]|uniref:Type II CAAX endopeptidase family protein n=1 Tax=Candidatus Thiothrix putei TaxID=3080811 RepID=A0AA95HGC4_9GAMM|nr:MAG: type II CAAX endopeptidase family protein [Candidatus Thiothrix putei]